MRPSYHMWGLLLFAFLVPLHAQPSSPVIIPANPPGGIGGACTATTYGYLTPAGILVTCVSNVWTASGGGSGGSSVVSCTITAGTSCTISGALAGAPVWFVDNSGNWTAPEQISGGNTTTPSCIFNAAAPITGTCSTISPVAAAGVGTVTTSGSPTTNCLAKFTGVTIIGNAAICDNGTTITATEPIAAPNFLAGTSPPTSSVCTAGTAGMVCLSEGTTPTGTLSAADLLWGNSSTHRLNMINNGTADSVVGAATTDTLTNKTFVAPILGAATATSLLATGNVDGTAPVTITTGSSATLGGTFKSGYTLNQEATAATAIIYTLPTAAVGLQYCVGNSWNGSAATTGTLEILTSASGQFIIYTDGTLSATGGFVQSAGAAADFACVVGVDATHWYFKPSSGTWTKH